jgi:hypothetical protein
VAKLRAKLCFMLTFTSSLGIQATYRIQEAVSATSFLGFAQVLTASRAVTRLIARVRSLLQKLTFVPRLHRQTDLIA